ncbi:MAG TPA: lipoate--protein ligase [Bacteroidota bacterium]|nr:lipoate--protein ligase [Bacteroidota bacterium]
MLLIHNQIFDPYFNIASEEYFFKNFNDNIVFLYRNLPSIIIGKHQNAYSEINFQFVRENSIPVIRRISGGGGVYHDLGNLNFAFIQNKLDENLSDFEGFTLPVINFLNELGVSAKFEGHNDLRVNGKKFSGNAEHIFKNRVLHHGTLLFNTNFDNLRNSLQVSDKYKDHAVKSVPSKVINLSDVLQQQISIEEFENLLIEFLQKEYTDIKEYTLNNRDIAQINKLVEEKYSKWEWNYAYFGNYEFRNEIRSVSANDSVRSKDAPSTIYFRVKNGLIQDFTIESDESNNKEIEEIATSLNNTQHRYDIILEKLGKLDIFSGNKWITLVEFIEMLF